MIKNSPGPRLIEATLVRAVDALERERIEYALMGGLASAVVGRPRRTRDLDLFVLPDRALAALAALQRAGFHTDRTDETWLYKAWDRGVLVDVIFRSKGGLILDPEMLDHRLEITVNGRRVLALAPEDLVVIKAMATAEHVPKHWYDAMAILATAEIDWAYVCWRARPFAARVLSLLLFAMSCGIPVPEPVLRELTERALRGFHDDAVAEADHHLVARVRQALATDPRLGEVELSVTRQDGQLLVSGEVATEQRRAVVEEVVRRTTGHEPVCVDVRTPQ